MLIGFLNRKPLIGISSEFLASLKVSNDKSP
jgi:hypothetical protein